MLHKSSTIAGGKDQDGSFDLILLPAWTILSILQNNVEDGAKCCIWKATFSPSTSSRRLMLDPGSICAFVHKGACLDPTERPESFWVLKCMQEQCRNSHGWLSNKMLVICWPHTWLHTCLVPDISWLKLARITSMIPFASECKCPIRFGPLC